MKKRIAVIGGGASGMTAAIAASRGGAHVTVYEGNDRLGKKLLATGNGKCNLGNEKLSADEYHGGDRALVASCLERFGTEETKRFFASLGLLIKEKNGYLYPVCEQAAVVLDVLRFALADCGAQVVCRAKVTGVKRLPGGSFEVAWQGGKAVFDSVILACGGRAAPRTGSDGSGYLLAKGLGLAQKETVPALVALKCKEEYCKSLAGVRADAVVRILEKGKELCRERGELQLVDYGISGIPVFQLSGEVNYLLKERKILTAAVDFLPDFTDAEYEAYVGLRLENPGGRSVEEFFTGILHKKLMRLFLTLAGLKPDEPAETADIRKLKEVFRLCRDLPFHITGSNSYEQAQACAGGVRLSEVTPRLESVKMPGLFLAGELLDVDGRCGGYNLQWAWSSGYIAGQAAAAEGAEKYADRPERRDA